ncbi:MAG: MOSC domain-containing protein [Salibacteraceae bacterium]
MKVISTNIAQPKTIVLGKETVQTGMFKVGFSEGVYLTRTGVKNDAVIDTRYHGGKDKACYLFGFNNYHLFQEKFPNLDWSFGMFGENLTIDELDESKLIIGSVYQVGEAEIMINEPRQPCSKLNYRFESNQAVKVFADAPHPGVYVQVLKEGVVKAGDVLKPVVTGGGVETILQRYRYKMNQFTPADKEALFNAKRKQLITNGKQKVIDNATVYVKELLEGEGSGHDWWHIKRVTDLAMTISKEYSESNLFIVQLAALLHDVGDHKFHNGDHTVGPKMVKEWLENNHVQQEDIAKIVNVVKEISYKGAKVDTPMSSIDGEIVQDADRLDAIGAIGIARTFAYGGNKNREMYNPEHRVEDHDDFEAYKKTTGPTINHFYEKLLLLKDRMNTKFGKELAQKRHEYMEGFLEEFYQEWDGKR